MDIRIKYTTIIVRDMRESLDFYTEVLGFKLDSEYRPAPGIHIVLLKGQAETMVELIKDGVHDVGFYSIGVDVTDLESTLKELGAKGAKILTEPVRTLVGSMAFIEDPNGVKMALIQHD